MARVKLGERLAMLLANLITGDKIYIHDIADNCDASVKTIQRDLKSLAYHVPINTDKGYYWMTPANKGQYNLQALRQLITTLGLSEEFPSLDKRLLSYLLLPEDESPFYIQSKAHEGSSAYSDIFKQLATAITNRSVIEFYYHNHHYQLVEPYKLVGDHEKWNLAMCYRDNLIYLRINEIRFIKVTTTKYRYEASVVEKIKGNSFI
ncbi:MAG: WYL domain-containing protein [Colwellia sp.]